MTQPRFDVTSFGEMLLRLSVPSGQSLEATKHMVITNKEELLALGKSGVSSLTR